MDPLEAHVKRLDTWAGPGQNETFSANLVDIRRQMTIFGRIQASHTLKLDALTEDVTRLKTDMIEVKTDIAGLKADVAVLKTDVAGLKADMIEVKGTLGEILDRLPPRQGHAG